MDMVEELSREYQLTLVDNVALIDAHPEGLLTRVHLSEEANGRLARAILEASRSLIGTK